MDNNQNKIVIITGGSRGIGKAIAEKFSENGATVVVTYKTSIDTGYFDSKGIKHYQCDASHLKEVQELIDSVIKEHKRVDVLVNNAGLNKDNLLIRMSEQDWDLVMNTNAKGVFNFTKAVAKELASRNINVNCIAPGYIDTDMTKKLDEKVKAAFVESIPLKRIGKPDDVANLVLFLSSDEADYITGQVICIDGGLVM